MYAVPNLNLKSQNQNSSSLTALFNKAEQDESSPSSLFDLHKAKRKKTQQVCLDGLSCIRQQSSCVVWAVVLQAMGAGCELARREATEATVSGMTPALALAWSCWKMKDRWPSKEHSN